MTDTEKFEEVLFKHDSGKLQEIAEKVAFVRDDRQRADLIEKIILDLPINPEPKVEKSYVLETQIPS